MPHSSDSEEAFESADEDVDRTATSSKKKSAVTAVVSKQSDARPTNETEQKLTKSVTTLKVQDTVPKPKERTLAKITATDTAVAAPTVTTASDDAEDTNNDGWDNWDDNDDETAEVVVQKVADPKATTVPKMADSEADGWDDWEDETGDDCLTETTAKLNITKSQPTKPTQPLNLQTEKTNPLDKLCAESAAAPAAESVSSWGTWKPWGGVVTNLLSTATEGVASITSHVTSAIESGMGVPGPEEMVRLQRLEEQQRQQQRQSITSTTSITPTEKQSSSAAATRTTAEIAATAGASNDGDDATGSLLFGQLVSGVTQIGNRVISGGLGTLEGIGKKTMAVLQENDPGLRNKRRMLNMDGQAPILSQILREAKETTEATEKNLQLVQKQQYKKQLHFETLFDDYHGLVHLEALEMLSRQSELKLSTLLAPLAGRALSDMQETLDEVKELCELPDSDTDESDGRHSADELAEKITAATEDLDVPVDFTDIKACWQKHSDWLAVEENLLDAQQLHDKGLHCLAETTALAVHKLHKLAELLLVKERHSTANEADALVQLVVTLCWHLGGIATRFGSHLSRLDGKSGEKVNDLITSTFLEGSNSVSYLQNGFQLFVPILQFGAA